MKKIRIDWGTGLVIGMVLFIGFILSLVFLMTRDGSQHELVVEDYFKQELLLEDKLLSRRNYVALNAPISGTKTDQGWNLSFPEILNIEQITGTVFLYRPSNKQLDFAIPLQMSGSNMLIPKDRLVDGRWNISVQFLHNGQPHLYEKQIYY